jgi:hypothetical protein
MLRCLSFFVTSSEHQLQRELAGERTADLIKRAESPRTSGQEVVQRRGDGPKAALS